MLKQKLHISVLVVDDEPLALDLLKETLSPFVQRLYFANDGSEALEIYRSESIDLIISDVDMPNMSGLELLRNVRTTDKHLPFILITGLKSLDVLIQAIEYKITSFIPKPVNIEELLSKIEEIAHTKQLQYELNVNQSIFEQYKNAVDVSSIVSKTNYKGIITYVNDRFCEISGYTRDELIGKPHNIVRGLDMPSNLFQELWETIQRKEIWRGVLHNRAKDGSRYTVKTTVSPIIDVDGNIYEFIAIREDITELENAKKLAERSSRIKSDFLANMSHEIRTPMNAIMGFVDLIKNTPLNEQQNRYLEIIGKSTHHLLSIVNEILDLSKIERNQLVLDLSEIDLQNELKPFFELYRPNIEEKNLEYKINIDDQISDCLKVDMKHLKQVLSNIISNAIKFTNAGSIHINVSKVKDIDAHQRLRFSIQDTGIGVAADKQKAIFDIFNQADTSATRKYEGAGLGLAISSKLLALMETSLQLDSVLGEGSKFYFEIDFMVCKKSHALSEVKENQENFSSDDSLRILVVEDNETNLFLMQELLKEIGYSADYAYNGEEAVTKVMEGNYDIVFMDINMPIMSGMEATQILRSKGYSLPIVALTANAMIGDKERFIGIGMDDYISKPMKEEDLLHMINKYGRNMETKQYKKELANTLGIGPDVVDRLYNLFFTSITTELEKLKAAIDAGDMKQIYVVAHKISGSASNLRFDDITSLAKQIEDNAKIESGVDYKVTYDTLVEAFYKAKSDIEAEDASNGEN